MSVEQSATSRPLIHYLDKSTGPLTRYSYRSNCETHAMKLLVHSFCADVNARGRLELCSHLVSRVLVICTPQHSVTPLCNFTWSVLGSKMLPFCNNTTYRWYSWNIGGKFNKLTCNDGTLLQYHAQTQ